MQEQRYVPGWIGVLIITACIGIAGWSIQLATASSASNLTVTFLDVGQGDATLIETPGGTQVLIDGGRANGAVGRALTDKLPFYDRSLDMVIGTHADSDHIGGLSRVLRDYRVDHVILPHQAAASGAWNQLIQKTQTEKTDSQAGVHRLDQGRVIRLGKQAYMLVMFPDSRHLPADTNDSSLVFKLIYGDTSVLLTGDITDQIEQYLAGRSGKLLDSDILKLAHHGSRSSSDPMLLSAVSPRFAVASAGKDNQYGHPHQAVINRLQAMNIKTLCTCQEGTITFKSDGKEFERTK